MNTCQLCNYFIIFTSAFIISILLIVYILQLPLLITNQPKLIKEYYYDNWLVNLHLDYFFIIIYLLVAYYLIKNLKVTCIWSQLAIIILVTIVLTGLAALYFLSKPITSSFFSRWFHTVKYSSIIYDALLIGFIFLLYRYFLDNEIMKVE
jgi:hypothetical protein